MDTKLIEQRVVFDASSHEVYEMLMDSQKHTEFTGAPAEISREEGGEFSAYGGYVKGKNVQLIPDKKIVQKWRDTNWPEGHYSTVTFELNELEGRKTELILTQTDVPAEHEDAISRGWHEHYWEKMKARLNR